MNTCPWCGTPSEKPYLTVEDYFLTHEQFDLIECEHCHLLFTVPRPTPDKIGAYYQSEEYYSHQENTNGFIPKVYEMVKSVNIKNKLHIALKQSQDASILDIGCGVGDFLWHAQKRSFKVTGIEPSDDAKAIAEKRLGFRPLDPSQSQELPSASFDVITMWHVLEHVDDLKSQISELTRLLRPGGRLVLALPNFKSYDAVYYKDRWAAWDVPRHLNHFCKDSIKAIFSETDLEITEIQRLKWDAYYISFLSEKYLHHTMPLIRGVLRGLISNLKASHSGEYSSLVYCFKKRSLA